MIIDAHADILTDISNQRKKGIKNVFKKRHKENFKRGEISAGIFVIWIDPYQTVDTREELIQTLKHVSSELLENSDILEVIKYPNDLNKSKIDKDYKKIHMIMGVEGLKCIEDDIDLIDMLYMFGIRHASLTWNESNKLATGVDGDENRGITDLGIRVVEKMEKLKMIIDLSHANEKSFWAIINTTSRPIIASHSNARSLCDHKRNLTNEQIKAIGSRKGFVGINIHKNFVSLDEDFQTIERFIDHIDHIVKLIGIDHVGFGFDFCEYLDEYENSNIKNIENISKVKDIISAMEHRGYSKQDIEKISYRNFEKIINNIFCE